MLNSLSKPNEYQSPKLVTGSLSNCAIDAVNKAFNFTSFTSRVEFDLVLNIANENNAKAQQLRQLQYNTNAEAYNLENTSPMDCTFDQWHDVFCFYGIKRIGYIDESCVAHIHQNP